MEKGRAEAFTDAIIAIIMTILVLDLRAPTHFTWAGFWALRRDLFAYTLSFFWLGTMWVGLHNEWAKVKQITAGTLWRMLFLLFWASLFPYTTKLVAIHYHNAVMQIVYGIVIIMTTFANMMLSHQLANLPENKVIKVSSRFRRQWLWLDIAIKCLGLIIAAVAYPPAVMLSVLISACMVAVPAHVLEAHRSNFLAHFFHEQKQN
jgi:uncharacterized membrane protein